jgi:hypothetical protein
MSQPLSYINPDDCYRMKTIEVMNDKGERVAKRVPAFDANSKFQYVQRPDGQYECQLGEFARDSMGNPLPVYQGIPGCIKCVTENRGVSGPSDNNPNNRGGDSGKIVDTPTKTGGIIGKFNKLTTPTKVGLGLGALVVVGLIVFALVSRKKKSGFSYCGMKH